MRVYYEDDWVTLYHGDCREVLPGLGKVDLVLTDPPYGLGKRLCGGTWGAKYQGGLHWDKEPPDISDVIAKGENAVVWGGNYFQLPPTRCWFVWRKPDAVATMADVDLAWTSYDAPSRMFSYSIAATNKERNGHPTQKPLAVMLWCIQNSPSDCETILDPFAGSGTTLVAAKQLGRKSVGVEICESYCEIAARRLEQQYLQFEDKPKETHEPSQLFTDE